MSKVFVFNADRCNGCHCCQFACKDEHCNNDWGNYSAPQPDTGQFWCKVSEKVRGQVPKVTVAYNVVIGAQDEAIREYAPEALMEREDGIIVLDPERCKGRRDIAERFEGVYYNEELDICQGCNGCAHLLDDGWAIPRCVDVCPTDALVWADETEIPEGAEKLTEGSHVYYLNRPKRFIGGVVVDVEADEVVIGATVTLENDATGEYWTTETDDFGDFWFKQIEPADYTLYYTAEGYMTRLSTVSTREEDKNVGVIELFAADEEE